MHMCFIKRMYHFSLQKLITFDVMRNITELVVDLRRGNHLVEIRLYYNARSMSVLRMKENLESKELEESKTCGADVSFCFSSQFFLDALRKHSYAKSSQELH